MYPLMSLAIPETWCCLTVQNTVHTVKSDVRVGLFPQERFDVVGRQNSTQQPSIRLLRIASFVYCSLLPRKEERQNTF